MRTFFKNKQGEPLLLTGLQCHNSSTGTPLMEKAIKAIKEIHGNLLEAPVYWYWLEPEQGVYDTSHVRELIRTARKAGLYLILLWFGANKNGHPTYVPEYVKQNPETYRLAEEPDGLPVPSLSPHCQATLEADRKAFLELMKCVREEDEDFGTVVAVQVENETGLRGTDRDYSSLAQRDFEQPVPEELEGIEIPDSQALLADDSWRGRFGRYANEVFTAWHQARYVEQVAKAGKEIYDLPMIVNAMIGHPYGEGGLSYNFGGPTVRAMDIWKKAAPSIDLLCPDIYVITRDHYTHFCQAYSREDNALFIPESWYEEASSALNVIRAAAQYEAIGICCFGAESFLDSSGELRQDLKDIAVSFRMVQAVAPLLVQYHGTGRIHGLIQEEAMDRQLIQLPQYRINVLFDARCSFSERDIPLSRGRGILIQTGEHEFYLTGDNVAVEIVSRPGPEEEYTYRWLSCSLSNQFNYLTVEEGHFEGDTWVVDLLRNGDEAISGVYARNGEVVRIRLNPRIGAEGKVRGVSL